MPLLIDGYNLLHASGIFGTGHELTELHRSREALLRFLAAAIAPPERTRTTIVFDAAGAPPGLPPTIIHEGMTVHFARDYANADEMLEELIVKHESPRTLTVVSSDHRVQRAARRRRATPVDSDRWLGELRAARKSTPLPKSERPQKSSEKLSAGEVEYWIQQFGDDAADAANDTRRATQSDANARDKIDDPFPPGYGDDLLEDAKE